MAGVLARLLPAGPLVVGEEHRAVFDADLDAVFLGELDDRRPDLGVLFQVLRDGLVLVLADEGADHRDFQQRGGLDHLLQVTDDRFAVLSVRVQRVGIISQRGDGQPVAVQHLADVLRPWPCPAR